VKLVQASNDPEKILTTPTEPVEVQPGGQISAEAKDIESKLRLAIRLNVDKRGNPNLVGLAANQIGIKKRVCICQIEENGKHRWVTMINPTITERSVDLATEIEGCGSIREPKELQYEVTRPREITVIFFDVQGNKMGAMLQDFSARVVQHEVDHLNGILISDRGNLFTP
jgi:peptide deformylase